MAEIMLGMVQLAIELGKCFAEPVKRQINYLRCFNNNVQNLREEVEKVEQAREVLQGRVSRAQNNIEEILFGVTAWLEKANEELNMTEIYREIANIKSGCLAIKSRYSLSKKVKKTTEALKKLLEACPKSEQSISRPPLPAAAVSNIPLGLTSYEFESRKKNEEDILMALKDSSVHMVGIYGMGGVGKTTMAERVISKAQEERLFDKIVKLTVSQDVDKLRIQVVMAEQLDLKLEGVDLLTRAKRLKTRLTNEGRILLFLDDVWECLDLEELMGIPRQSGLEGCTILLTSRDSDVLCEMEAKEVYEIRTLSQEEAWSLFTDKTGVDDPNLLPLAQAIVSECKGLPIALVNVAAALKVRKYKPSWEDALQQLKSSNPVAIPKILGKVYNPLKLSYNFLESQHAKSIFLLCCIFREDYEISLEDLALYAMGLRMFEDIKNLGQVRSRTWSLIEMLRSRSMLLEGVNEYRVRMHDVVRDVAIFIATEERRIKCNDCTWASPYVGERTEFPVSPNLNLLLVEGTADEECQIDDSLFRGKKKLNVLSIKHFPLRSLPRTIKFPRNLRTLILRSCEYLETICVVSEFVNLEVLICRNCDKIKELPKEIARLKCLRLLEISDCRALLRIAEGVISSLDKLEELRIVRSFNKWEGEKKEGGGGGNARLSELESLSNLTCLEIEMEDYNLAAQHISLPPKIVKYAITIGGIDRYYHHIWQENLSVSVQKKLYVHLPREITLGNWIHECVKSAECMYLGGDGSKSLNLGHHHQNIRWLHFKNCSLTSSSVLGPSCGVTTNVFPLLERLALEDLANLEEIGHIDGPLSNVSSSSSDNISFKNLRVLKLADFPALKRLWKRGPYQDKFVPLIFSNLSTIRVSGCHSLPNLLSLSTTTDVCFLQLESLFIEDCVMMEQVFLWSEEENEKNIGQESRRTIGFPKLKRLTLKRLPRLKTLCQGIETIEVPLLTEMKIYSCPQLKSLAASLGGINGSHDDVDDDGDDFSHFLCKPKVSFGNLRELCHDEIFWRKALCPQIPIDLFAKLEELVIRNIRNDTSLFSFSVAQSLASLKRLGITNCMKMEKVIEGNDEISLFPNLKYLYLNDLPELKIFCDRRCYLELPKVGYFNIENCPSFSLGSDLTTPNLKTLRINDIANTNEFLNDALQIEWLTISSCEMMEHVVTLNSGVESVKFPKLKTLELRYLPRLTSFCSGSGNIEFPLLTRVEIEECPNLKSLVSASDGGIENDKVVFGESMALHIRNSISVPIWCYPTRVNFLTTLVDLTIKNCVEIRSLFSFSIACNLVNLRALAIERCREMVKVIEVEEEYSSNESITDLFPHLAKLILSALPELKIFSEFGRALKLPSLSHVKIDDCPKLERFSLGSLTTPQLKTIEVVGYPDITFDKERDLNGVLQQLYLLGQKEEESTSYVNVG